MLQFIILVAVIVVIAAVGNKYLQSKRQVVQQSSQIVSQQTQQVAPQVISQPPQQIVSQQTPQIVTVPVVADVPKVIVPVEDFILKPGDKIALSVNGKYLSICPACDLLAKNMVSTNATDTKVESGSVWKVLSGGRANTIRFQNALDSSYLVVECQKPDDRTWCSSDMGLMKYNVKKYIPSGSLITLDTHLLDWSYEAYFDPGVNKKMLAIRSTLNNKLLTKQMGVDDGSDFNVIASGAYPDARESGWELKRV